MVLAIVVVTAAWWNGRMFEADPAPTRASEASPALAATALRSLEEAVRDRDPEAAARLAPPGDEEARGLLTAVVHNAGDLRVADFSLRYVDDTGARPDGGGWSAVVDTAWRFDGFDEDPALTEVEFSFVTAGDRAAISDIGGGDARTPVWLSGRVTTRRTEGTLVLAAGGAEVADRYARLARRAVPVVHDVLGDYESRLVVEVPATAADLHAALAASEGEYANIAAVTTTVGGSLAATAPVHVFVNPEVYGDLEPTGARVVMSHEATHVATTAATSAVPLWLLEGFADYVALQGVEIPLTRSAGQIARRVEREGVPDELPGRTDFQTRAEHLGATYEAAWLACVELAEVGGEDRLVRFYRRVADGTDVSEALREVFGFGADELVAGWQQRLQALP